MAISRVENTNSYIYNNQTINQPTDSFILGNQNENIDEKNNEDGKVPAQFAGMSFEELMNCSEGKRNQIPIVNQIVSSKNPEDGKIYRTYFTDNEIQCHHADGKIAWKVDINEEQRQKVNDYFKEFTPYKWAKELYSGENMGMATLKSFWLNLFNEG